MSKRKLKKQIRKMLDLPDMRVYYKDNSPLVEPEIQALREVKAERGIKSAKEAGLFEGLVKARREGKRIAQQYKKPSQPKASTSIGIAQLESEWRKKRMDYSKQHSATYYMMLKDIQRKKELQQIEINNRVIQELLPVYTDNIHPADYIPATVHPGEVILPTGEITK